MRRVSENALSYLANALWLLDWFDLLVKFGLADEQELVSLYECDYPDLPSARSRDSLDRHLEAASRDNLPRLLSLCGEILRQKNVSPAQLNLYGLQPKDGNSFLNFLKELEEQLDVDGYFFDGFKLRVKGIPPSIVELADQALHDWKLAAQIPFAEKVNRHFSEAEQFFSQGKYTESMTNLRLALSTTLKEIARRLPTSPGEVPFDVDAAKELKIRDHLRKKGVFSEEEKNGVQGIYGLLSAGPHGKAKEEQTMTLLGYAACKIACHYAIVKYDSLSGNVPV